MEAQKSLKNRCLGSMQQFCSQVTLKQINRISIKKTNFFCVAAFSNPQDSSIDFKVTVIYTQHTEAIHS